MSPKLDAIFSMSSNCALAGLTEAPIGLSGKRQAESECTHHN